MYTQHIKLERVRIYNLKNVVKSSTAWHFILIKITAI